MRAGELSDYWDDVVRRFLEGDTNAPDALLGWRGSYQGGGDGAVDDDAMPEPFLGSLLPDVASAVFLALNPGRVHPGFQSREGVFADEIRGYGDSYTAWASSWPYLRDPWVAANGGNRHHTTRLAFLRTWTGVVDLGASAMVSFELFPWHSARVTSALAPHPGVIDEYVWEPIADLRSPVVFAFGAPWFALLPGLDVEVLEILGAGGQPYGSKVASRSVLVGRSGSGTLIIAEKHSGSAGPPSATEALILQDAISRHIT